VLYPQAAGDKATGTGCWNWEDSDDDPLYDTRQSLQLSTVVRMVDDIDRIVLSSGTSAAR
jgi:hypothetical protein